MTSDNATSAEPTEAASKDGEVERLLKQTPDANYVDTVVRLYEASEQNYRAAVTAGTVIYGFTDSTNY